MFEDVKPNSDRWFSLNNLLNEEWKNIKGYENLYQVSNYGRIKSLKKHSIFNNRTYPTKILKCHINTKKYLDVELCRCNKSHRYRIHRLVAEHFIPNLEKKPQVNHIDGNKQNNRIDNLEWCTNGENGKHAWDNNLRTKNFGKNNHISKKILQYTPDKKLIKEWDCIKDISRTLGYNYGYIISCCQRKYKLGHNFIWRYKEEIESGMEI